MNYYIGLDVSMKETSYCVLDCKGTILKEGNTLTDPDSIAKALSPFPALKIGLESGSLSHWLLRELLRRKLPACCIDARTMASVASCQINKTDRNDARAIAKAIRAGYYREVTLKAQDCIEINNLLVARSCLVKQRVTTKNSIRGLLKSYGMRLKSVGKHTFVDEVNKSLEKLGSVTCLAIKQLLSLYITQTHQLAEMNDWVEQVAKSDPVVVNLMSIPGVGPLTALSFRASIADPHRFNQSTSVAAYLGLTPRQYSSGETQIQGRVSKSGHGMSRSYLVEAANVMLTRSKKWSVLKAWAMKVARLRGVRKATVALARKLAVLMHRMMITGESFQFKEAREPVAI